MSHNVNTKNYLILCELHHLSIHGKDEFSNSQIDTHYLVYDRFQPWSGISYLSLDEEYDTDEELNSDYEDDDNPNHINKLQDELQFLRGVYSNPDLQDIYAHHPIIRNYRNIISNPEYIKPEIGQCIILPTQETIAILKTFWLKIIQRKWKKIFAEKQQIINQRQHPSSLYYRQIYGKWPETCNNLPSLNGMLYNL